MTTQSSLAAKYECADSSAETPAIRHIIAVAGEDGWASAEELKERALDALRASDLILLDFSRIDYLEASGLQVVLALGIACATGGKVLELLNLSSDLRALLDQCGAADHLFSTGAVN